MSRFLASGAMAAVALAVAAPAASAEKMVGTTTKDGDQDLIVFDADAKNDDERQLFTLAIQRQRHAGGQPAGRASEVRRG